MKSCEEYLPLLSLAVDGMLTKEEEAELSQHLLKCEHCRGIKAQYTAMSKAFSELSVTPPEALHSRVMEAVTKDAAARRARSKKRLLSYCAAAAACFVLVGVGLSSQLDFFDTATSNTVTMAAADDAAPEVSENTAPTERSANTSSKDTAIVMSDGAAPACDAVIEDSKQTDIVTYETAKDAEKQTPMLMQSSALSALPSAALHCTDQRLITWLTEHDVAGSESSYTLTVTQYTALIDYLDENAIPYEVTVSASIEDLPEEDQILLNLSPESVVNQ